MHEVHALDNNGPITTAAGREDLDAQDGSFFGDAVGLAANCAGDVGAVALVVDVGSRDEGFDLEGSALELLFRSLSCVGTKEKKWALSLTENGNERSYWVASIHTRVYHVDADAFTGGVIVNVASYAGFAMRYTSQAPRGIALGGQFRHGGFLIGFDIVDLDDGRGKKKETLATQIETYTQ